MLTPPIPLSLLIARETAILLLHGSSQRKAINDGDLVRAEYYGQLSKNARARADHWRSLQLKEDANAS